MFNVLIVEDNLKINELITLYCKQDGYNVFSAISAEEGLTYFEDNEIDLIVTDLMLPSMSGEDFVRLVRDKSDVYIIILTAKIHIDDKLSGLKLGADDYLIKPFSTEELLLKIKNFLSRSKGTPEKLSLYNEELVLQLNSNMAMFKGNDIEFTANEYKILMYMATHKRQIYSREQLLEYCFGNSIEVFDRIVDVYIKNIRKKLNEDSKNPKYIKTIYGLGYMFVGEFDD